MMHLRYLYVLVFGGLMTACQSHSFTGGGSTRLPVKISPVASVVLEEFPLNATNQTAVDIVWAIDNSGSMKDKIAQVRKNFDAFVASLSTRVDVKIILLSSDTGALGLQLSTAAIAHGGVQVKRSIASHNAAEITSSGILESHFRADASRAYVFVTDDESNMAGGAFVKAATDSAKGKAPKVYSFRGVAPSQGANGCQIASVGEEYSVMENLTGGQAFDICLPDWTASFSTLAEAIKSEGSTMVTLKGPIAANSLHVFLDDLELKATDYQLTGLSLSIVRKFDLTSPHKISVKYSNGPAM